MKTKDLFEKEYDAALDCVEDIAVENGFAASPGTGETQDLYDDPTTISWGN